jgi:long-chain fatty acid transport protein
MHLLRQYVLIVFAAILALPAVCSAQGIMLSGVGPVNRAMGGAGTGAPLDPIGALYTNPASITALNNQVGFGVDLLLPVLETRSSIAGFASGSSDAEPGVSVMPSVGWVHHSEQAPVTYGFGMVPAAGFRTNYAASTTNPVLAPQSNTAGIAGGFGRLYTEAGFFEMLPTIAVNITDHLSIGFGPTITVGQLIVDPLIFAAPDDADGTGAFRYPSGRGVRNTWGGGFQAGVYYEVDHDWSVGASFKSPQWMEEFRFQSEDELGLPRTERFGMNLPLVASVGGSYRGVPDTVFAVDVRYFDYANTEGFDRSGFRPDGSVAGLGWDSIFAVAVGIQRSVSDSVDLRCGYVFNQNPIPDSEAMLAVGAPLFYQHQVSAGATVQLTDNVDASFAYAYALESDVNGVLATPAGAIPGSSLTTTESVHLLSMGLNVRY